MPVSIQNLLLAVAIVSAQQGQLSAQVDDDSTSTPSSSAAHEAFENATTRLKQFNHEHSRVFEGGRVPIHYLEWTDDGIPLVLLHGTYNTAHDFVRFAPRLIEAGYRPISIDWYGHGETPIPDNPVAARDFSNDLNKLIDSLAIEKTVIAGHSRGGVLASDFYDAFPDRVFGLILIDGGSTHIAKYFAGLGKDGLREWLGTAFDEETGTPLAPSYATLEELFSATWERFGKPEDPVEMFDVLSQSGQNEEGRWTRWRQNLSRWLQQDTLDNTVNGMLRPDEAPLFFGSTVLFEPLKSFEALNVPILILDADGSAESYRDFTPAEENEKLQQLHPNLIEHVQFATGHHIHRSEPDAFIAALIKFQDRIGEDSE